jgi:hypothetical protein
MEVDFGRDSRMWLGLYENELAHHVRALCASGSSCFDVGAEGGFYALVFARLGGGRVLAVEASAHTCERLRRSVAANPALAPSIEVLNAQVVGRIDAARGQISLDDLAYGPGGFVPDLVKLDVEGKERAALSGAARLLGERKPHLIVETHSQDLDEACREILVSHGYAVETVEPRRWLPEVRPAPLNRWLVAAGTPRHLVAPC